MKKLYFTGIFFLIFFHHAFSQGIVINEVLASNTSINTDEDGSYHDWVELYNTGSTTVNLSGYGLSDDPTDLFKWSFPNVSVAPGQYLLVWCSDKNRTTPGSPLHTNWKISASGETVSLTNASGTVVDSAPATALDSNISLGRQPNGSGSFAFFNNVTPNAANASVSYSGFLNPPAFSQNGGFFTSSFNLTLTSPDPTATILYTLDGSDPDPAHIGGTTYVYKNQYEEVPGQQTGPLLSKSFETLQYNNPIAIVDRSSQPNKISSISSTYSFNPSFYIPQSPIFKGTVVKARAIKSGSIPSKIETQTYFVTPQGANRFSLPVISLSVNEDEFFDYYNGIYVAGIDYDNWRLANPSLNPRGRRVGNYYRNGINYERRAGFSYFVNGTEVIHQDVGLRIHGGSSRRYEKKSLSVFARADYGDDTMNHQFFPDLADNVFTRLTLSNSGSDYKNTLFRDALSQQICKYLHNENENYQPAIAFINGEYWGITNVRERYDDDYFKRVYNIDDVDLIENQGTEAEEGDTVNYQSMINFVQSNSLAVPANYDYIKTRLDPESFADFFIANIYLDNSDWPGNNVQCWRKRTASYEPNAPYGHDGRWRWALHDMDDTFSFGTDDFGHNNLAIATTVSTTTPNPEWSTLLLRKMLENPTFKQEFISRFADLMNTTFLPSRVISIMNTLKTVLQPEIAEQVTRWNSPHSVSSWNDYLTYETSFANARPAFQRDHIREKFGINSNINVTLNVSAAAHGYIKINTIDIVSGTPGITSNPYPWTGVYFSDIPVKLKAVANTGYVFSHWTGVSNSTDPEIVISSANSFSVTAVFVQNEPVQLREPIYFWMMNNNIPNNLPLQSLNSTYEIGSDAVISYQSCLVGYPFTSASPSWRKASMERRNNPTDLNYRPEANGNAAYVASAMKGLQVTQPFQSGGLQNTMIFNLPTTEYKDIKFSFAVVDEGAATGLVLDYCVNEGTPVWITTGLTSSAYPITSSYQLVEADFTNIPTVSNNPNFKIRLRFTGPNMTADTGARVTFNNIALDGIRMPLVYPSPNTYQAGVAIAALTPEVSGGTVLNFTVSPTLPAGLSLNAQTGVISGTPTTAAATSSYTVTANYSGGSATFNVVITVNPAAPGTLTYSTPNIFNVGTAIPTLNPVVSGGQPTSYVVSPSLPAGLSINAATGVISGTPTTVSSATTYTVTATNISGSAAFNLSITVNPAPPTALSYNSPNIFLTGQSISPLIPTVTGTVTGYTIAPALPSGLIFNTSTGVISGTPTNPTVAQDYVVTATNSGGSVSFAIGITVNESSPSTLTYTTPNVFTVGTAITPLNPSVNGTVSQYTVSPALPAGITINASTGVISGTPTSASSEAGYTITAVNSGGNTSFNVVITVNDVAPSGLSYSTPNNFLVNELITPLAPSVSGNNLLYAISPALPNGLLMDANTGVISGTPTVLDSMSAYTVTASNSGGSISFEVLIAVVEAAPSGLSYTSPNIFAVGSTISSLTPSVSGSVNSYTIAPPLPAGLTIDTSTGIISGTPTVVSANTIYTVTAANTGGSVSFSLSITVNDVAPHDLAYPTPIILTVGVAAAAVAPTVIGNVTSYSIFPTLPAGMVFNTSTGVISGTPTIIGVTSHTITSINSGGSDTADVAIVVNDVPPSGLSYNSPNIYTVGIGITPLSPTVNGNVVEYTVVPDLPPGLHLSAQTGQITGTPIVATPAASYTITAENSGGLSTFTIGITVMQAAPTNLVYTTPNVFTIGDSVSLAPTVTGNVSSYSISPALPSGLTINPSTGVISGTPIVVSAATSYTVIASNNSGSTTFVVSIAVNDLPPSGLTYNTPNIFMIGSAVSLTPNVNGNVSSYSISPGLPSGLTLNPSTGVISGTPTVVSAATSYTVTAANNSGSTTFVVSIAVNDLPPSGLTYNTPNIFTIGSAVSLAPTVNGNVSSYSISPALPSGLTINPSTGVISGTPTVVSAAASYTVIASNNSGSTTFVVSIAVNDLPPSGLTYSTPNIFMIGSAVSLAPTFNGNVSSYSISPGLPSGLTINPSTGVISGTPTVVSAATSYTVTAANNSGSTTFVVSIAVNDLPPSGLTYNTPNIFTIGSAVSLAPTVNGNVSSYSISPGLPSGLTLNPSTGVISGTPTVVSAATAYTVTAANNSGSTTFVVSIAVNDLPPSGLTYNTPNIFTIGSAVSLTPTVTGNVSSYSISPGLPSGLTINPSTGVISGTPTVVSAATAYTVTAANNSGSTTFVVSIAVNDLPPSGLTYNTPNVFIVGNLVGLSPTITGTVTSFSITPQLPPGLQFDTESGVISGIPTETSATAVYLVTAQNSEGSSTFSISITVNDAPPTNLVYTMTNVFTLGSEIGSLVPGVNGNVTTYSIAPALPTGLSLDPTTGVISGTPTVIWGTTTYTITAENASGSTTFVITIAVNDIAPSGLSYSSPNTFTVGTSVTITPEVSGNVTSYSIVPQLPAGLQFDPITGIISGTPTEASTATAYTITAENSGGITTFDIVITVEDPLLVDENDFQNISVYPNPSSDIVNIDGLSPHLRYKLYSVDGRLIQSGIMAGSQISIRDLPDGVYVLRITAGQKMIAKKIVKK